MVENQKFHFNTVTSDAVEYEHAFICQKYYVSTLANIYNKY